MFIKRLDIVLAALLALAGAISTSLSYSSVVQNREPGLVLIRGVPKTPTTYAILNGNGCIGRISAGAVTLPENVTRAEGILRIRVKFNKDQRELLFHVRGEFNPLLQLSTGDFSVETKGFALRGTAIDVNPITITVTEGPSLPGVPAAAPIPGPLTLRDMGTRGFQLEYSPVSTEVIQTAPQNARLAPLVAPFESLLSSLTISAEQTRVAADGTMQAVACNDQPEAWLDFTVPLTTLSNAAPFVRALTQ